VGWEWALPAVLFSGLTVVLAVWAALPRESTLSPGNLNAVDAYFTEQIKCRGRLLKASGIFLCLALFSLPLPFLAAAYESPDPVLGIAASSNGSEVQVVVEARHIGSNGAVYVGVASSSGERVLARSEGSVNGVVDLTASLLRIPPSAARIFARVRQGDDIVVERSMAISDDVQPIAGSR
jgi:hypothetical protein